MLQRLPPSAALYEAATAGVGLGSLPYWRYTMQFSGLPAVKIPMRVSRPKGSRTRFDAAVARLAPYQGTWTKSDRTRQKLSRQLAEDMVEGIARRYNTNVYLEGTAPRSSAVIKKLRKLKRRSDALARELREVTELNARIVCHEARIRSGTRSRATIFEAADISGLIPDGRRASSWDRRVSSLSKALEILSKEVPVQWERQGRAVMDKGAKRNHYTESEGTAKWRLLTDGLYVYGIFKPGQATGTEENDLHQFVNEIFEYAVGKEPKNGLLRPLRDLIKPTREENHICARNDELREELDKLAPGKTIDLMSEEELKKCSQIHQELHRNFERQAELSRITWPHAPLPL